MVVVLLWKVAVIKVDVVVVVIKDEVVVVVI